MIEAQKIIHKVRALLYDNFSGNGSWGERGMRGSNPHSMIANEIMKAIGEYSQLLSVVPPDSQAIMQKHDYLIGKVMGAEAFGAVDHKTAKAVCDMLETIQP